LGDEIKKLDEKLKQTIKIYLNIYLTFYNITNKNSKKLKCLKIFIGGIENCRKYKILSADTFIFIHYC